MSAQIVAVPIGSMDASGTGVIDSIQHANVTHTQITHEFRIALSKAHELFGAFTWADVNTEDNVDASSGYANFDISLNQTQFASALAYVIANAVGGKATSAFTFETSRNGVDASKNYVSLANLQGATRTAQIEMDREIRNEVEDLLDQNDVLEYLEGDSLGQFSLVLDASGGGADMADKLGADNTAALRNLLMQLPNRNTEASYTAEQGDRLPVKEGDAVAFIFNVSPVVTITQSNVDAPAPLSSGTGIASGSANDLSEPGMQFSSNVATLATGTRKIAFVIDVTA